MRLSVGVSPPVYLRTVPDLVGGDVDLAVLELEPEVVALDAAHGERLHLEVAADAVLVVHDVVARLERVVVVDPAARAARAAVHAPTAGEVGLGDERELGAREHDAPLERRDDDATAPGAWRRRREASSPFAGEDVVQSRCAEPVPSAASTTR